MGGLGIIGGPDPHHFSPMAVLHNDSLETASKARTLSINIHLLESSISLYKMSNKGSELVWDLETSKKL